MVLLGMTRKYRNKPTEIDGKRFASRKEAARYAALRLMEKAGEIADLECQPQFPIVIYGEKICTYIADFSYRPMATIDRVVEDCKSPPTKTPLYRLKKKLVKAIYGVEVKEV